MCFFLLKILALIIAIPDAPTAPTATMSFLLLLLTVPALAAADPAMTALRGGAVRATTTPGAVAGISEQGVQTLLRDIEPALEAALGHMHIPDFRNKHIHLQNMRTQGFQCQPPCISANMGGGGSLAVRVNSFKLGFHVRYKVHEIITLQGACDMKIEHTSANAAVTVGASGGALHLGNVQATIHPGHLDTHCHGITGSVINLLSRLFETAISNTIRNAGESAIRNAIQGALGKALSGIHWTLPFNDGVVADFSPVSVVSSPNSFSLETAGLVRAAGRNEISNTAVASPAGLPAWDGSANRYLQVMVSSHSFETAGATYFRLGRLNRVLTDQNVPELNTQFMALVAPGIVSKFGKGKKPMQLRLYLAAAPTVSISSSAGVSATAEARLEFSVANNLEDPPLAIAIAEYLGLTNRRTAGTAGEKGQNTDAVAFTLGGKVSCELSLGVGSSGNQQYVRGSVKKLDLGTWSVQSTEVGKVNLLDDLLDLVSGAIQKFGLPAINQILAKGIPLPSSDNMRLKNTVIAPRDGYVLVASDFDF